MLPKQNLNVCVCVCVFLLQDMEVSPNELMNILNKIISKR